MILSKVHWLRVCSALIITSTVITAFPQPTWKHVFGGYDVDIAHDAILTQEGNVVVAGSSGSFGAGSSDVYLFKVDPFGIRMWSTVLGTSAIEVAYAAVEMNNGDLVLAGVTNGSPGGSYDGLVMRTDANGSLLWQREIGGGDWDVLYSVDKTMDDGVILTGLTYSWSTSGQAWMAKVDAVGDTVWTRLLGEEGYFDARSVKSTPDGGFVIAGAATSASGDLDALVAKYDAAAELEWFQTYGGDSTDFARDIILTSDGGYSVVGVTESFGSVIEQYHFKIDGDGGLQWQRNWGQVNDQEGFEHVQLASGEYASIGFVSQGGAGGRDMFLLRTTAGGDFILGQTQGGAGDEYGHALLRMDGGFLMCGITESYGAGMWDVFLVRTNEVGFTDSNDVFTFFDPLDVPDHPLASPKIQAYPNPSNGRFTLRSDAALSYIRMWDHLGREVHHSPVIQGSDVIEVVLPSGTYTVEALTRDGATLRTRVLIVKP